jgi:ribosome-associated protein
VEIVPGVRVVESSIRFRYARSSGPGGQNVNKVNTKAELWVSLDDLFGLTPRALDRLKQMAGKRLTGAGEIHIASDTERTQEANRTAVLDRLRALLAQAVHEPKARRKTKPSRASKRRRLDAKRRRGEVKANRRGGAKDW